MIKVNNKNITYVALADSNNSVKGVKEIWYADSNNSVKLVYRRKDALIEGEDYEKYHWLVGDADAYINTLKYYRPYDDSVQMTFRDNLYPNRVNKYNKHNAEEQIWGGSMKGTVYSIRSYISGTEDNSNKISNNILDASTTDGNVNWGAYAIRSFINASPEHSLYISSVDSNTDKYYFIYNGDTKDNLSTRYTLPELIEQDVLVFYNASVTNGYFNGSFFNFIHYRNNVEITHLIPCKLLKPIPKWLDANGIRRQVGECGMIDLVSGKFYGNVNSVGTFTVENYYERKEWLQSDGSAYIDTNIIVDVPSLCISTSFTKKVGNNTPLFGSRDYISGNGSQIFYLGDGNLRFDIITKGTNWIYVNSSNLQNINQLIVDCPNKVININEITVQSEVDDLSVKNSSNTFKIYSLELLNAPGGYNNVPYNGAFGNFTLNDSTHSLNLIPCTLTMDLPASMDANNIARTKGTSGMWDLVSDKFYGNVANSGTFKAVNLAEGVDYEVHQWLKGDGTAYIDTLVSDLTNVKNIYCKIKKPSDLSNISSQRVFGRENVGNYSGTRFVVRPYNNHLELYTSTTAYTLSFTENDDYININAESNTASTSQQSKTIEDIKKNGISLGLFADHVITFSAFYKGSIGEFTIDGTINLIPVKLLRSIPSKYDANGIARQAGECGMYDTVNDLFYGNVASSGSFTVEDDS